MSESTTVEATTVEATTVAPAANQISADQLAEILTELEQYRDRLISDMTDAAKKAKMTKSAMEAHIAPELAEIDLRIQAVKELQAQSN